MIPKATVAVHAAAVLFTSRARRHRTPTRFAVPDIPDSGAVWAVPLCGLCWVMCLNELRNGLGGEVGQPARPLHSFCFLGNDSLIIADRTTLVKKAWHEANRPGLWRARR